jgi:hypothetical protein
VVDVASAFVPALLPVAIGLSAEKGVHNMVDGNYVGGALMMAGSVGNLLGGAAGDVIGDAVTVGKGIDRAVTAAEQGNIFAAISGFAGVAPNTAGLIGGAGMADTVESVSARIIAASAFGQAAEDVVTAAERGNVLGVLTGGLNTATLGVDAIDQITGA